MKKKKDLNGLIGLFEAARVANATKKTILDWDKKGWIQAEVLIATRLKGRPGKLYKRSEIERIAKLRGRI